MTAPRIPGFRYLERLGSGGFADVFLYEQEWPRQQVAVKVVRPDVPLNQREKVLFAAEANAMARLADHPYIVSVMTAGVTEDGRPYLIMRYCPPPDLGVRVRANPMSVSAALSTGIKIASAVETAHRSGIVHRDIKPSNVLVTVYSEPALTDFGIAGSLHEIEGDHEVRISYPWSPPEMLDGRSNGSVASDVYSLGATIWHLLVGRSPFSEPGGDNSTRALTARILHAPAPATQRSDVPAALDQLLQQCLAKDPSHRPGSALDVALALQRIEHDAGLPRTPIAVEGDRRVHPGEGQVVPDASDDPDATRMKPPAVVDSQPRGVSSRPQGDAGRPAGSLSRALWVSLAVLAFLAAGIALYAAAGRDHSSGQANPSPSTGYTPTDPALGAPTAPPVVTGTRSGDRVRFTWHAAGGTEAGDTWEWTRTDTGVSERTRRTTVRLVSPDRICVNVRLIRDQFASPWANSCVSPR